MTAKNIAEWVQEWEANPDYKSDKDWTVKVDEVIYRIPFYCLVDLLWGMPDDFYPCDKWLWCDYPVAYTTLEMIKKAIAANPNKFKAFILY